MATFLKRLARATPIAFANAFAGQSKFTYSHDRIPFGVIAAIFGGVSYLHYFSEPDLAHLEPIKERSLKVLRIEYVVVVFSALNPDKWIEFKLQHTARVSHNSQLFRFTFDPNKKLGLDVASCVITRAPLEQDAEGKPKYVKRPYSLMLDPESKGYFDLLIKVYPEGNMSQHFASVKPGDVVEMKGPIEKLNYTPNMKKHIGMIAGGIGITPMLQVIEAILKNPDDNTQMTKLDVLAAIHPNLKLCGPLGMMQHVSGEKAKDLTQGELTGILKEVGYTEQMVYKF